jgi:histidyl-tRNA synthetase
VIVAEEEMRRGTVILRDLERAEQSEIPYASLAESVQAKMKVER